MSPDLTPPVIFQQLAERLHELQLAQAKLQAMLERLLAVQERTLDTQGRLLDNQAQLIEDSRQQQAYLKNAREQQQWNEQQDQTNVVLLDELRELRASLRSSRQLLPEQLLERLLRLEAFMNGQLGPTS